MNIPYDLIDSYVELPNETKHLWNICPSCLALPRIWEFDNGRSAACKCNSKYDNKKIYAISIGEYYRKHNTLNGFPDNQLRENWNKHTEKIKTFLKLEFILKGSD